MLMEGVPGTPNAAGLHPILPNVIFCRLKHLSYQSHSESETWVSIQRALEGTEISDRCGKNHVLIFITFHLSLRKSMWETD